MINALRAAIQLRVQDAKELVGSAHARMIDAARQVQEEGLHPQDLQRARALDDAVRNLLEAEAFARGVRATCRFLADELLREDGERLKYVKLGLEERDGPQAPEQRP